MTRAGSKLVLRTSPAPGHYLCIKWDFASLTTYRYAHACRTYDTAYHAGRVAPHTGMTTTAGRGVQRLVAKTVDVKRETALVVGSDNVLLGIGRHTIANQTSKPLPEWGAFPVVRLSIR